MKIAIGYHLQSGPWGGGNQFARSLIRALEARGDSVRYDLEDGDLDIILLTDPRWRSPNVSFGAGAILRYLSRRNPRALVVHRINECDERKGTHNMNRLLRWANYAVDYTVFIASWLEDLDVWQRSSPHDVILNGADATIFRQSLNTHWDGQQRLKLVTHHWGGNHMKGFDVFTRLDRLLAEPTWRDRIEFTYIGNLPAGYRFQYANYLSPLNGEQLARELAKHHVYITASVNEPAGMHHIEGALSGLPVLYRNSGALPEYCSGFGIEFVGDDFIPALESMFGRYAELKRVMPAYPHSSDRMCAGYLALFDSMLAQRQQLLSVRRLWRAPLAAMRNMVLM
ncbi:MAG: hypothetical protein A2286_10615 [Gammaproteobacteria bacterium RIFOXYA12_FULL_61_12]|nr:MAG: hypothetical protein A2514_14855 [Gammaproteobacteria bacterium RIFOXYD12_FULL_61_37]OGT93512.1 MAG: hypothetical protein A2286_10615 [Gammaproteobacteria bacterium RIFOXYA12_FULL_61_12]